MGLFNFKKKEDEKKSKEEKLELEFRTMLIQTYNSLVQMSQEELNKYRQGYNLTYAEDNEVKAVLLLDYLTFCLPRLDIANLGDDHDIIAFSFKVLKVPAPRVKELRRHLKQNPLSDEIRSKWS